MMAEQKGRGGKKPKYQIADIGGPDLTPQDISTERVLNFLIKGEAPAEQGAGNANDGPGQAGPPPEQQTAAERVEEPADTSLPPSGPQGKKSLDHLFRRASAGGAAAKDLKLDLRGQERLEDAAQVGEIQPAERARPAPSDVQAGEDLGPETRPRQPDAREDRPTPVPPQASPATEPETRLQTAEPQRLTAEVSTPELTESAELAQLIALWKSFYRLKDGEIEVLSAMYRMSHGVGSDECYVKMHNLAEMSNLTYRYCQKVVRSLEQLGWITKLKDYDPTTQLGVLYRVNLKPSV
jgi:predicted transcriptional regulator